METKIDVTLYELRYFSGGHGGPYANFATAVEAAVRHIEGLSYSMIHPGDSVTIVPRTGKLETVEALRLTSKSHACYCPLCEINGQRFLHISVIKTEAF